MRPPNRSLRPPEGPRCPPETRGIRAIKLVIILVVILSVVIAVFEFYNWSALPTVKSNTWEDALAKVGCSNIEKVDGALRISAHVIVSGKKFEKPFIVSAPLIELVTKRCP
jgi:hypothetical protein